MACTPPSSLGGGGVKNFSGGQKFLFCWGLYIVGENNFVGAGGEGHEILKENSKLYNPTIKSIFRINIL